ncbi:glutathione S-transferase family protein [Leptospira sp. 2 VSF19]|uniref:Glutathione S-transferase family protein n=1 Tax=Leptospira soteropolitanensis TaxID=2950025 RepID=A0AAW5VNE4_9LEPT|nr:glutathione S-transferase family protein [Leptospira soteropolitanensis]MCW7493577.1 glutathione S-transferase family protein [Leptospira soteropolitanensis]MCW7501176.1 glutathione S-transferase family protein [Leptospira soteropolitanensis]MCW7523638.1 glutathione S-transferase family protein [Leptospira soteropolitanensis]MCW7527289.1 glutathione S-transferase family protein [Leptospira soteropolitanensis]MCW7531146.1 glutathione S-transferase family protein [Leptospira soteropolitanensi
MDNYQAPNLLLYYHPLASFCHKVLIALYENDTEFEPRLVDLLSEESSSELFAHWPVGKIPLLRDRLRQKTIPETTIIIEYLNEFYPGKDKLIPSDFHLALETRLWDRFFDLYVSEPMQKIVIDRLRPENQRDLLGVEQAYQKLPIAYGMLEAQLNSLNFIACDHFSMADCSAVPALFYADTILSFRNAYPKLTAYFERLLERQSVKRTIAEAEPYFYMYPLFDKIPKRFLKEKK